MNLYGSEEFNLSSRNWGIRRRKRY